MSGREKSNLLAVSTIVTDGAGMTLLHKRTKEPDLGTWELFATYPYLDEPLETAVQRVLGEKAGVEEVTSLEFSGKYYDRPNRHPGKACVPLIFIANVPQGVGNLETTRWFSANELADLPIALDNKDTLRDLGFIT